MRSIRALLLAAAVLGVTGCAQTYTYDGKQYNSRQDFLGAVDSLNQAAVNSIAPLPSPVSKKRLVFAVPTHAAVLQASIASHTTRTGMAPHGPQLTVYADLAEAAVRGIRYLHDASARRNIYSQVRLLQVDSLMAQPAPSAEEDVLYYNEPNLGAGQWYFGSAKIGRQAFAFDRAQPTMNLRAKAFVESLQLQAIRD